MVETPRSAPRAIGSIVADTFRIEEVLGEGGMGVVYGALHVQLEERVALKFLHSEADAVAAERFRREAQSALRIKSEHVAHVTDIRRLPDGTCFLVMEHLRGKTLRAALEERGPLPVADAAGYLVQACDAIAEAHSLGIIHRDLKPSNLFLTERADGSALIKVLDFGIAKVMSITGARSELTTTTELVGSPSYMAPEQFIDARQVGPACDIWALGVVLYSLLSGRQPFEAEGLMALGVAIATRPPTPLASYREGLPEDVLALVSACLEKEPARRLSSVAALATALLPFCTSPEAATTVERIQRLVIPSALVPVPPLDALVDLTAGPVTTGPMTVPVPTKTDPKLQLPGPVLKIEPSPRLVMPSPPEPPPAAPIERAAQADATLSRTSASPAPTSMAPPAPIAALAPMASPAPAAASPPTPRQGGWGWRWVPFGGVVFVGMMFVGRLFDGSAPQETPPLPLSARSAEPVVPASSAAPLPLPPENYDGCLAAQQFCVCDNTGWAGLCDTGVHKDGLYCHCDDHPVHRDGCSKVGAGCTCGAAGKKGTCNTGPTAPGLSCVCK